MGQRVHGPVGDMERGGGDVVMSETKQVLLVVTLMAVLGIAAGVYLGIGGRPS
jgi:hypothetical protein